MAGLHSPFDPFAKLKVSSFSDANGDISTLTLPLETSVQHIVLTRLPDKQLTERSFIEAFAGHHTRIASFPGAPDLEPVPRRGTACDVKDQSGATVEFKRDASGKVTEAALNDNDTAMVLKKK